MAAADEGPAREEVRAGGPRYPRTAATRPPIPRASHGPRRFRRRAAGAPHPEPAAAAAVRAAAPTWRPTLSAEARKGPRRGRGSGVLGRGRGPGRSLADPGLSGEGLCRLLDEDGGRHPTLKARKEDWRG